MVHHGVNYNVYNKGTDYTMIDAIGYTDCHLRIWRIFMRIFIAPLFYVLTQLLTTIFLFYFFVFLLGYSHSDMDKISIITIIVCSLEGFFFGFFYREITKYQKWEFLISSSLIGIPFLLISRLNYMIFDKWLTFQNLFHYSGTFWLDYAANDQMLYIVNYIVYYIVVFNIGVFICEIVNKKKFQTMDGTK